MRCPDCKGSGYDNGPKYLPDGMPVYRNKFGHCFRCSGSGEVPEPPDEILKDKT